MRKKEGLADYRYFPEPDLPSVILCQEYVDGIQNSLPELPEEKRRRYEKMGLGMQDVLFLANDKNVSYLLLSKVTRFCTSVDAVDSKYMSLIEPEFI